MQNSKVIHFLKCLSTQELREFGKFVRSPFHNNRKDVVRLFDILKKFYPKFDIDEISKENIFEKLYPGKQYNSNALVLLSSYLFSIGKEFLTISNLSEDRFFHQYFLLNSLDRHHADDLFEKEYRSAEDLMKHEKLNKNFFHQKSLLEEQKINFNLKRNRQDKVCRDTVEFGELTVNSFIIKLAQIYHDLLVDKMSFNFDFAGSSIEKFLKYFNIEQYVTNLNSDRNEYYDYVLYYYYLLICNYYPQNEHYYKKLKEYSFKDFEKFHSSEKSARFHFIIDYCMLQLKSGNSKFLQETFGLYTEALERKLYQTDFKMNEIGLMFFRNFVTIGLAAKEYDYVEKFIAEYGPQVKEDVRDDLLELSYAMLYYEKKEFIKALESLSKVSNSFPLFKLATKHILIKIYYETNQYEAFSSLIDTYKHYLKNERIIPDLIKSYHTNFLNYLGKLLRMKSSGYHDEIFALKKKLKENPIMDIRHRLWLIEKAEELEKLTA